MAINDDIGKFGRQASEGLNAIEQIQSAAQSSAKTLEDVNTRMVNSTLSGARSIAKELAKIDGETLKSLREQKKFRDATANSQREIAKLEREGNYYIQKALRATKTQAKEYKKLSESYFNAADHLSEMANSSQEIVGHFNELNKSTKFFRGMSDLVDDVPVLRRLFSEFKSAAEASEQAGGGKEGFLAGLTKLSILPVKAVIGFMVSAFFRMDQLIVDIGRGLGVAGRQAQNIANAALGTGMRFKESLQSILGFQKALGNSGSISKELGKSLTVIQSRMGMSAEQAGSLYEMSTLTGQSLKDTAVEIAGVTKVQNALNGRSFSFLNIMKDVADASALTRLQVSKFPGGIAKAVYQVRKLGLNFASLEGASSNLLNFQSSIEAELEAELLTGKQLNLQKARELALKGDLAGLGEEIVKQVGTEEQFLKMNVFQREAIAKAVGMTQQELAKSYALRRQDAALGKMMGDDTFKKYTFEQKLRVLRSQGLSEMEAQQKLQKEMGEEAFLQAVTQETTAEKLEKLMDSLVNTLMPKMETLLTPISNAFDFMNRNVNNVYTMFKAIGNLPAFAALGRMLKTLYSSAPKVAGEAAEKAGPKAAGKIGLKTLGKMGGKAASKMIPGAAFAFALSDFLSGDTSGAILNTLAGIFSLIPGGQPIAGGLGVVDIMREVANATSSEPQLATGGIVNKRTRVVAGEAGPEAIIPLTQLYAKLDELIAVVKTGGDVYMDGRKVGESLALGYNKL